MKAAIQKTLDDSVVADLLEMSEAQRMETGSANEEETDVDTGGFWDESWNESDPSVSGNRSMETQDSLANERRLKVVQTCEEQMGNADGSEGVKVFERVH